MTDRTPYMQEYYRKHRDQINDKVKATYRDRKYKMHDHGTEFVAPGLFRLWVRDGETIRDAGMITWEGDKYSCEFGRFKTKTKAIEAMIKGLQA